MAIVVNEHKLLAVRRDGQIGTTATISTSGGGSGGGSTGGSSGTTYTAGNGITIAGTVISANFGTTSTTVACGSHTHTGYLPVAGCAADSAKLNNQLASYYAVATHNHAGIYLPIGGTAVDSDALGGQDASYYAIASHTHAGYLLTTGCACDSKCFGAQEPSYYATATHLHGNITANGCIGGISGCILVTTTNGCITVASSATPSSHSHGSINNGGCLNTASGCLVCTTTNGCLTTVTPSSVTVGTATNATSATNAACLGGQLPSYYATATHNHTGTYLPVAGCAADSAKLNNQSASYYATATHTHTLNNLSDVETSPTNGHILFYSGTSWNSAPTCQLTLTTNQILYYNGTTIASCANNAHTHAATCITSGTLAAARLPIATASCLGGIRIGTGLSIDGSGIVCATGGGATCLDALTDVVVTTPASGQLIQYNGTTWCNTSTTPLSLTSGCIVCYNGTTLTNVTTVAASALPIASATCIGGIRIGTGLSIDGSGIVCATGGGNTVGYAINVHAANLATVADACTYYFGGNVLAPLTTADRSRIYIPKTGAIKTAYIVGYAGTAGSAENWSMYIRVNNSTDTLIETKASSSNLRIWCSTSLNISVSQGNFFEIKSVFPTWATNPANLCLSGQIYIE